MWNNRVTTVSCAGVIRNGLESVTIWSQSRLLRNNLVRSQQQRLWDGQPEGLGGFEYPQGTVRMWRAGELAERNAQEGTVRGGLMSVHGSLDVVAILAEEDGERLPEVCFVFYQQDAISHPARLPHVRVVCRGASWGQRICRHGR